MTNKQIDLFVFTFATFFWAFTATTILFYTNRALDMGCDNVVGYVGYISTVFVTYLCIESFLDFCKSLKAEY